MAQQAAGRNPATKYGCSGAGAGLCGTCIPEMRAAKGDTSAAKLTRPRGDTYATRTDRYGAVHRPVKC